MTTTLLIIDDDTLFCHSVAAYFQKSTFNVAFCHNGREGLEYCRQNGADVVLLDQRLPDGEGLDFCRLILDSCDHAKVVFITAYPSFAHAVEALRSGAHDYLLKPVELEELQLVVERAFRTLSLERVEQIQQFQHRRESRQVNLIGIDGGLQPIGHFIELACANHAPVLLTGETGTGKNVVAKTIHYQGTRASAPYVDINCAALPESLIESELFGHERGAFTGAGSLKKGVFEMADGGTLLLDEIGELPLHLQSKLLGVLDDGTFRRLGGERRLRVDVRIIAATNMDLESATKQRRFREDLYYRMSVLRIHLPPLRHRNEDIEALCHHFLQQIAPDQQRTIPREELNELQRYGWPGNVRELKNIVERALLLHTGDTIHPAGLIHHHSPASQGLHSSPASREEKIMPLAEVERLHIERVLHAMDYNHTKTADALGIARSTLLRKLERYRLKTNHPN